MTLAKGANTLYEQGNTEYQYTGYIICIFASIEYDGLSVANMQE